MKVLVIGAGGIIGQHMMTSVPDDTGVEAVFTRRRPDDLTTPLEITPSNFESEILPFLKELNPDVIVNLAGEASVDIVEKNPKEYDHINTVFPTLLAAWCDIHERHLIHVSTQAVYSGEDGPYRPETPINLQAPVNEYGRQKARADWVLQETFQNWTIIRPTFVMGIRPMPNFGRANPAETMLAGNQLSQVDDRKFSVAFAWDVAKVIWDQTVVRTPKGTILVGTTQSYSRYDLYRELTNKKANRLSSEGLDIAPRARDTTYGFSVCPTPVNQGLSRLRTDLVLREDDDMIHRARELAAFTKKNTTTCLGILRSGFHAVHAMVADSFRKKPINDDNDLLEWYKETESYLWELTVYHTDKGWNYSGMCEGIATKIKNEDPNQKVLVLGDGVGTLSIALANKGLNVTYHDLAGSKTSAFANARFSMRFGGLQTAMTPGWAPDLPQGMDTIISLDFMEHLTEVEVWVRAIYAALKPGGFFLAQNAFAIGSGPNGSIPCHLERNDRFEKDWAPLMEQVGFELNPGNWWRKK